MLDALIIQAPQAREACEAADSTGLVLVFGEISTACYVDMPSIAREEIKEIGYARAKYGFDGETSAVITSIEEQSPDIALGVNQAWERRLGQDAELSQVGAGAHGIMFGYATDETPSMMPMPIELAHRLAKRLADVRKQGFVP